jgi:diadenosine tetraphosphate (Ap4A) HIT family hydrolase
MKGRLQVKETHYHTHIEPLRKGDSNIGRFKLKEGEIKKLKEKGR